MRELAFVLALSLPVCSSVQTSAGIVAHAPHASVAEAWMAYLQSGEAQTAYSEFGFKRYVADQVH